MSIELVTINGFCNWIDYESFETDLNHYLEGKCQHAKVYLYNNFPVDVSSEDLIDLLIIIAVKDTYQNYFQIQKDSDIIYLKNLEVHAFIQHLLATPFIPYIKDVWFFKITFVPM